MPEQMTSTTQQLGESGGIEYGAAYFRHQCGIPYERNEHWLRFFGDIADGIIRALHPTSVLDAGCAMGFLVEALHRRGVDARGVDISDYAISRVHESVRDRCSTASLIEPLQRRYDLITCIEVLEHIPAPDTDRVIANLCRSTDRLLLSTTPEDYGEASHLNVQPPEAWSAILAREGFLRDLDQDVSFVTPWAAVYTRRDEPLSETVRTYDRAWWQLRREVFAIRQSLLDMQERMSEFEDDGPEDKSALRQELDRLNEEVLRLRDLLIGKDAELGSARGQLAALESQAQQVANIVGRIQSKAPRAVRLSGIIARRLQALRRG